MIIRRDQMRTFQAYMRQSFEDRMVTHIKERYASHYAHWDESGEGDARARALVQRAVDRAGRIGAKKERSIQRYIEIMLESSPEFETDEAMAWAHEILHDESLSGETRVALIHRKMPGPQSAASQHASAKE